MDQGRVSVSNVSSVGTTQRVEEKKGRFLGKFVKQGTGKSVLGFVKGLLSHIPGYGLLDRMVKVIMSKSKMKAKIDHQKGEFWEVVPLPTTNGQIRNVLIASALAQVPYTLNSNEKETWDLVREAENFGKEPVDRENLTSSDQSIVFPEAPKYSVDKSCFTALIAAKTSTDVKVAEVGTDEPEQGVATLAQNKLFKNIVLLESGMLVDSKSGLTAVLVRDESTNKLTLVFGGTLSGYGSGTQKTIDGSTFKGKGRTWAQIKANIQNFTGWGIPRCYRQAALLTEFVMKKLDGELIEQDDKWVGSESGLTLTGHSLGGGLVQYASAKNAVPGMGFSSAALGKRTLASLTQEQKLKAKTELVTNYLIHNDPVNTPLGYKSLHKDYAPTLIGKRSIIKGNGATGKNNLYGRHSWSHLHYYYEFKSRASQGK